MKEAELQYAVPDMDERRAAWRRLVNGALRHALWQRGPPMKFAGPLATLGSTAAARARLIVWCATAVTRSSPTPP